jgi:segregation and condensation protein A
MEYKVQFEVFEGPLDLLLYLVKKEEVDIYQVNLTRIATQFLEYIEIMRQLDLDVAGDFLVMAATLMYIKSRELLPVEQQVQPEESDDGEDPRWELIRQLVEYKKFKDAAARLQGRELEQEQIFPRIPSKPDIEPPAPRSTKPLVSVFDLVSAVSQILKRHQQHDGSRDIIGDRWTVSEKIDFLRETLERSPRVGFFTLFAQTTSRSEVVVTFLALLELIRLRHLVVIQTEPFGDIDIGRAQPEPEDPAADIPPAPDPATPQAANPPQPDAKVAAPGSVPPAHAASAEPSPPEPAPAQAASADAPSAPRHAPAAGVGTDPASP